MLDPICKRDGLPKNVVASAAFGPTGHIVGDIIICPSRLVR